MLMKEINLKFRDKYDFFYLPIDFTVSFKFFFVKIGFCLKESMQCRLCFHQLCFSQHHQRVLFRIQSKKMGKIQQRKGFFIKKK